MNHLHITFTKPGTVPGLLSALAVVAAVFCASPAQAQNQPQPLPFKLSPYLPHDVFAPIAGATDLQPSMDFLSWETFVALNWPASEKENGVPDANLVVGGQIVTSYYPNGMRNSPVVWETFKDANDIFLPDGKPPSPFKDKARHVLFDDTESFTTSPLNDQNGRRVYYEVRLSEVEYNYIVSRKLYLKANQTPPINFPPGDPATSEAGSIHIKAAWKILNLDGPGQKDNPDRFYTSEALIYTPGKANAFLAKVGLVGLHIVHKTVSRPEWIWATFEQVDNAADLPQGTNPITPGTYNFTNAACPVASCTPNQPVSTDSTKPVQVLRVTPIDPDTQTLNQQWQAALHAWNAKSVWQYYQLISTQWPGKPENPKAYVPTPAALANTVIETFFQGPSPSSPTQQDPPHSCMDCHGLFVQNKDFMFQLDKAYPRKSSVPGIFVPPPPAPSKVSGASPRPKQ